MLTIEGEKRAEILSKQEEMQNLDKVYCSNYTRAMQTAKIVADIINVPILIDSRFIEVNMGIVEGRRLLNQNEDLYHHPLPRLRRPRQGKIS